MDILDIGRDNPRYPPNLMKILGNDAPETIRSLGDLKILESKKLALLCSIKCPGEIILKTYDLAHALRETGETVISGFHSPMEKEVLNVLVRSQTPVVICPARSMEGMRLPRECESPLNEGRLLLLSPFEKNIKRPTVQTTLIRNKLVAALSDQILIAHASPGGKTEDFCQEILEWGKPLFTLESDYNKRLIKLGAKPAQIGPREKKPKNLRIPHDIAN